MGRKLRHRAYSQLSIKYSPHDLDTFEKYFHLPSAQVSHEIGHTGNDFMCELDANSCNEANLDVQYMTAMSPKGTTTYWYADDFQEWILAVADKPDRPLVHSISYGADETKIPDSYKDAFNVEAMKLGAQGVTIFVSSGDDGASSSAVRTLGTSMCGYKPSWPATSPYVTAVGATQGGVGVGGPEVACSSDTDGSITTGGGFSTYYETPVWQQQAVDRFFELQEAHPAVPGYNTKGRGIPDVAMHGYGYKVVVAGKLYVLSGTSASSPVLAGIASLVNADLLSKGKPPIGFMNPTLYSSSSNGTNPFNDIIKGNNKCVAETATGLVCCDEGFEAVAGWDPLTGLGTIDHPRLSKLFGERPSSPSNGPSWFIYAAAAVAAALCAVVLCCLYLRWRKGNRVEARAPLVLA